MLALRYTGKIVVPAAQAATQFQVSAEARARLPDIEAHVTFRVAGMEHLGGPSPCGTSPGFEILRTPPYASFSRQLRCT